MYIRTLASNVLMFILSTMLLVNATTLPGRSSYSPGFEILNCNNLMELKGCRHEIGHKMDHDLGEPSRTVEFTKVLDLYKTEEFSKSNPSSLSLLIAVYPTAIAEEYKGTNLNIELYAAIYSYVDGDVSQLPELIRMFYSTDQSYLDLYSCLAHTNRVNICGWTSFSFIKAS